MADDPGTGLDDAHRIAGALVADLEVRQEEGVEQSVLRGDIELMVSIRRRMGDRFSYLGGLPTAEVYAAPYKAMGVPVYSSAVFNFIPQTAMDFYHAVAKDDVATQNRLLDTFFLPYLEIRNKSAGYAVSIVKAGARIVGHDGGPVRPPLTDLKPAEVEQLSALIAKAGVK